MRRVPLVVFVVFGAACAKPQPSVPAPVAPAPASAPAAAAAPAPAPLTAVPPPMTLAQSGILAGWLDRAVDPCQDFYQYACGGFTKTAEIPADRSSWGTIPMVVKETEEFEKQVLEDAAAKPGSDPVTQKIGAYYAACMDEAAIEKAGVTPIQPLLDQIKTVTNTATAARTIAELHADGIFPFFDLGPVQDFVDATQMIASLDQAGLGLPDRKYYLQNTDTIPNTRKVYRAHQARMFQLLGLDERAAKAAADHAFRVETAIAKLQQDDVTRRDPHAVYHRVDRAGLDKVAGGFPWGEYLAKQHLGSVTAITVNDPKYFAGIVKLLGREPAASLRDYLTWTVLRDAAPDLSKAWVDEAFVMTKELAGVKELPPRWRRCVHHVDNELGELLAQSYVKQKFAGNAKASATALTKAVLGAMRGELDTLPWMDDATRGPAKQKLDKMAYLVGYPDTWKPYDFTISSTDFAGNVWVATRYEVARQLAKIGKPVDRLDWHMTPPTVNAYYDNSLNELVLPAGQLQPPFYGPHFHPAVNFGDTGGGTIGHEMTHGFDDEGSQFDADGNLRDWWSKSTTAKFKVATTCIQDQYSKYEAVPHVHLDGKLTSGENIADNGGVKLAYEAYKTWRAQQATPVQRSVDGMSDDQLFYLGYAQSWCMKITPEALTTSAHSDPHSPPQWRVNGVIVNQPGFAEAFSCKAGAPMAPAKNCSVW
ncbi:MAG: M13 family metallopeptidase [Kofleriaceae bacterium]